MVFLLVTLVAFGLLLYFVMPHLSAWLVAVAQELNLMNKTNLTIEQLDAFRKATIHINLAMQLCVIIVMSVILWLGRSWLLAFPHISVRSREPSWETMVDRVSVPPGFIGALVIALFLPSVLGFLFSSGVPMSIQFMPSIAWTVYLVSLVLSVLSFLSGLSILSLAYAKAVGLK